MIYIFLSTHRLHLLGVIIGALLWGETFLRAPPSSPWVPRIREHPAPSSWGAMIPSFIPRALLHGSMCSRPPHPLPWGVRGPRSLLAPPRGLIFARMSWMPPCSLTFSRLIAFLAPSLGFVPSRMQRTLPWGTVFTRSPRFPLGGSIRSRASWTPPRSATSPWSHFSFPLISMMYEMPCTLSWGEEFLRAPPSSSVGCRAQSCLHTLPCTVP